MCGSISRYLIQNIASVQTDRFYLTLAINIAGSLAIGIAWVLLTHFNAGRWANGLFYLSRLFGRNGEQIAALDAPPEEEKQLENAENN